MLRVDGYRVGECLQETSHSEVYSGTRDSDGLRVVLKLYRGKHSEGALDRANHEFELLQRIQCDGVVRPVELRAHEDRHILIVECVPGLPLSRYAKDRRLTVAEVLSIALGITRTLAAVHDARVIHKDLKLANILIDPEQLQTSLIDFGIAAEFGRAEGSEPPLFAEGTMRYIAPEQTGRIGLGVDFRTDLYSLGVILYELLAGQPPFGIKDPLALIHAHISLQPQLIVEIDPRLPLALSRIVAKLLEKDPERRYQTARGLAADLEECQKQLLASGEIDEELELGSEDASDRLRFPNKIYGRERESAELCAAFERIAQGGMELVLLAGPAGIGKSVLPSVLRERLARTGAYLAQAKFDPELRERPYAGFAAAFSGWVDQILPEREERLAVWKEQIRSCVGAIGQVLVELAPNLTYVVKDFPPVPTLGAPEARERLALAVVRFVRAVAQPAHPLVLLLDDLQWADAGSLFLLGSLLRASEPAALLVIGGYRDNEVDAEHPLTKLLQELGRGPTPVLPLDLGPLRLEDTTAMLAEALGRAPQDVEWLARRVGPKSQHNPLLVRRLMFHLWDRDLIRYEHGHGWQWDEQRLTEAEITDDAAALVAARIDALPERARELVQLASLIGTVFETEVLVELSGVDPEDVLQELMNLVALGLIAPCRDGFKFVHDRLREAAQSRLGVEERAELHYRTAQLLLVRIPPERLPALCFELAEHLSVALDRLSAPERPRALEILHLAGRLSLEKGVPGTAAHYLHFARNLVCEADWKDRFDLAFDLFLRSAEAAFQTRDFELCLQLLAELEKRPLLPVQRARMLAQRISVHEMLPSKSKETLDLVLAALAQFGVRWPRTPSLLRARLEMLRTDWILRGPLDQIFPRRELPDMSWLAPIVLIGAGGPAMMRHSNLLLGLAVGYVLRTYRRYSIVRTPAGALASYASLRAATGDLRGLRRYVEGSAHWIQQKPFDIRAELNLSLTRSWITPRRDIVEPLQRTAQAALEIGDLEYSHYALHQHVSFAALSGEALPLIARRIDVLCRNEPPGRDFLFRAEAYRRMYALLQNPVGPHATSEEFARIEALTRTDQGDFHVGVHGIAVLYFLGELERAEEECERIWPQILYAGGLSSRLVDYMFYRGLCHAARAQQTQTYLNRRRHLRTLRSCLRRLHTWARFNVDFIHMAQLLRAESSRARGHSAAALRQYREAAQQARKVGYIHHAALCHERRAALLEPLRRHTEAASERAAAIALYEQWGAHAKVFRLERSNDGALRRETDRSR